VTLRIGDVVGCLVPLQLRGEACRERAQRLPVGHTTDRWQPPACTDAATMTASYGAAPGDCSAASITSTSCPRWRSSPPQNPAILRVCPSPVP
jgi:hypothetical protein